MSFLNEFTHLYVVGAGGIGISAVAKFCLANGKRVAGCDLVVSDQTKALLALGGEITIGQSPTELPTGVDLVVYSEAVPITDVVLISANKKGIKTLGHFEFFRELAKNYFVICVTGTHGKSTTTAMLAECLIALGMDPTVFVGSVVPGWELGNLRIGKVQNEGKGILLIEGDEYKRKMLSLRPAITLITNIEADHLEIYGDLSGVVAGFQKLVEQTTGVVFVNKDDAHSGQLSGNRLMEYGASDLGEFKLLVPGIFNRANAAGARAVANWLSADSDPTNIDIALQNYRGIWRRFEVVGEFKGATVISDYAHHPTAIKATLKAVREFYPDRRIVLLFEPHQHRRTMDFFEEFSKSFELADELVLSEIYGVTGRTTATETVSSKQLLEATNHPHGHYALNLEVAEALLRQIILPKDVLLVMGAGDVDQVARRLV